MTDILRQEAPDRPVAILSGPSFAADVAAGLPTAVTLASADDALARSLCRLLHGPNLRLYHSSDVRGVEVGGAAKNVLAIACGVAAGRGLGASAAAALIARGFAELRRFGDALGARPVTLMGLSGLGDLVLTCSSAQSRNFSFGMALGRGETISEASEGRLAEGAFTALGPDRDGPGSGRRHADRQLRRGPPRGLARRRRGGRSVARPSAKGRGLKQAPCIFRAARVWLDRPEAHACCSSPHASISQTAWTSARRTVPAHLAFLNGLGSRVKIGGALLAADCRTPIGSMIIFEAESEADVHALLAADPYSDRRAVRKREREALAAGGRPVTDVRRRWRTGCSRASRRPGRSRS